MKKFIFKWFRLGWGGCYGYLIVSRKKKWVLLEKFEVLWLVDIYMVD